MTRETSDGRISYHADVLILGAGQAGLQAALSLREGNYTGSIHLIGGEPALPYQRPPLSKGFLNGKLSVDSLTLRPRALLDELAIEVSCGRTATAIDRLAHEVLLDDGTRFSYGHLIIATGSRARRMPGSGTDLDGVFHLRSIADAERLAARLPAAGNAVVVGAGFIGLEFAAVAAGRGLAVTIVEAAERPMARVVSTTMSKLFRQWHEEAGVRFHLGASVAAFEGEQERINGVRLADGRLLPADIVLVGIGGLANDEIAEKAGLPVDNGIVVDEWLRTTDPSISAIGDCSNHPNEFARGRVRLESVQNAIDQAKCVAARLSGQALPYRAVPWFWSDQGSLKLQMAGLLTDSDTLVEIGSREERRLSLLAFRDGRFVGAESVNRPADTMLVRRILARTEPLTLAEGQAANFDLKSLAAKASSTA